MPFPPTFIWGAAASAYQIEGAVSDDGKGPSIWDFHCRIPGAIHAGHTGDTACDHYHRFREDVALMQRMNLRAYRFSISWPRVLPEGTGPINPRGLDFYDALTDALLAANIEPWITLFHWDYPSALQCRGGWLNRDSAPWFADYAAVVVDRLSDRARNWITLNEPQIFLGLGHGDGTHAPGLRLAPAGRLRAAHHALLAHGLGVQAIRSHAKAPPAVGWAPIGRVKFPATDSPADIDAARRATLGVRAKDFWNNTWFADPVCLGRYPQDGLDLFAPAAPPVLPGDMETINQPLDFYGLNIYDGEPVRAAPSGSIEVVPWPPGHPQTAFRWPIAPESLYWGPRFIHERYRLPIVITENGLSNTDWPDTHGRVRDPQRTDYTRRYLRALERAMADGVDVRGYFHWSVLDNFEWAEGYKERFGLIHVDFTTQARTPKDSAAWYARVIESNGASLGEPAPP